MSMWAKFGSEIVSSKEMSTSQLIVMKLEFHVATDC